MATKKSNKKEFDVGSRVTITHLGVTGEVTFAGEADHRLVKAGKTTYSTRTGCLQPAAKGGA